ncbi:MAG: pantetheine-phosphate adenylyltransferase [Sulfurovum sp.]|nr:pantetheine-phosphate adenylyltransferase [Sulfurovum sp.]MCB4744835.1 pantetheine-phosphate adenylyltransferase [Sulfurovum sp.]MCB4746716.1 pantetheine-phosphate adenylyltransferase [Sulfurovum sp.]MCB4747345.1 pantetheine-phosphate adenylyltransferase [Sulfurovum sp.]MCB4748655.1 pantetheine-phosphate adenylyltransferase [Sulfurovum sp.]
MRTAIYPGTFDPITNGHLDIITRACKMFDRIIVAVAASKAKEPMFTLEQRIQMVQVTTKEFSKIEVVGFDKLLVNLAEDLGANIIVRGLRAISDFEYELQMGYANASLKPDLETIYLMPNLQHAFVSSSVVRTILAYGGKVDHLLHPEAYRIIGNIRK